MIETTHAPLRARETVKRRSGRPSHGPPSPRRGTASPPPTGSGDHGGSLGEGECRETRIFRAADRRAIRLPWRDDLVRRNAAGAPFDQAPPGASVMHGRFLRLTWIS